MKRIISALSVLFLIFGLASCGQKEVTPETYIGEGAKIQFRMLVDANQKLYNDVFVLGRLECDEGKAIEKDGVRWAPVIDKTYPSYTMFVENIKGIYTEECAKKLLEDYDFYGEIDGVFCRKVSGDELPGDTKWVRDTEKEPVIKANDDGSFTAEYRLVSDKKTMKQEFTFVKTEAGYRLDELRSAD
ncbi:MAG: hypothetical protein IKS39_11280 [Clostridia bacterium]|nr:hypothetical protein [Clostridia bacterium]